jgi:hypothetical protein
LCILLVYTHIFLGVTQTEKQLKCWRSLDPSEEKPLGCMWENIKLWCFEDLFSFSWNISCLIVNNLFFQYKATWPMGNKTVLWSLWCLYRHLIKTYRIDFRHWKWQNWRKSLKPFPLQYQAPSRTSWNVWQLDSCLSQQPCGPLFVQEWLIFRASYLGSCEEKTWINYTRAILL